MPVTRQNVESVFTYHAPDPPQIVALQHVRESAKALAYMILDEVPQCADQQAALRLLREAVMTANAAIVLHGEV
jgi:hypothetical protein